LWGSGFRAAAAQRSTHIALGPVGLGQRRRQGPLAAILNAQNFGLLNFARTSGRRATYFQEGVQMKNLVVVVIISLLVISCNGQMDKKSKQYDIKQIYKILIDRANTYDNAKVKIKNEIINIPIDSNAMVLIKGGVRHFNDEVQKSIDDYNKIEDATIYAKILKDFGTKIDDNEQYQLSKIGFDDNREYAVLYESDYTNADISHKSFIFLKKIDENWTIDTEIME
jgi:hypothetical protein